MEISKKFYQDFDIYSRALIVSKDVDPTYPFIKNLLSKMDEVEPEWFIFCYVAFYSLETAILMVREFPTKSQWDSNKFLKLRNEGKLKKFGHERRGTARNPNNQVKMFDKIVEFIEDIEIHKIGAVESPLIDSNEDFRRNLESLPMHGGWASFKIAELFEKSLDFKQFSIPDLGLKGRNPNSNDGPVGGLRWLFGRDLKFEKSNFDIWDEFGANLANGWGVDIGEVETCLCKWHKFVSGKYFIGHDIQEFVELEPVLGKQNYEECMSVFPEIFWKDKKHLEKNNKRIYKQNQEILYKEFAKELPKLDIVEEIIKVL